MIGRKQYTEFGVLVGIVGITLGLCYKQPFYIYTALLSLVVSLLVPILLRPFTWLWFKLAFVLEKIISTFILLLIFYGVMTPVAFLRSLLTKQDPLKLKEFKKAKSSVFYNREHCYEPQDLHKQF
ncbi:hypothetical protein ORI89_01025 [Sphingobacterium sp. UT-1RO-CII-1]|uniref:hypothetical protein n=1 Tax=Sphingobacterium sp. UT-1RO-CII-1 TaxID=2995225 RepID=UPI00227A2A9C|nr:hypothetical protein [Sphingobacterium sp. UT-1RO-CII-1]MCY4778216.1 hypothetical protein [Sphingobacterium sp. UT-1RO-CII-1]